MSAPIHSNSLQFPTRERCFYNAAALKTPPNTKHET